MQSRSVLSSLLVWCSVVGGWVLPAADFAAVTRSALGRFASPCLVAGSATEPAQAMAPASATEPATRVLVSHILLQSEELARVCEDQLASGMEFAQLAETVSMCESAAQGGLLGWISPGLMVPEFDEVAFRASPGEVKIVESPFGWHLLRVAEASHLPLEISPLELRERIINQPDHGLQVLDIRDAEELEKAPIIQGTNALHLPYEQWQEWAPKILEGEIDLLPNVETIFIDHRGGRGERMAQYFMQNNFPLARYLAGGINGYAEEADPSVPTYLESAGDCLTCHEH